MENNDLQKNQQISKKTERIKLPVLVPLFASILVLLATFTLAIYQTQRGNINNDLHERIKNTNKFFQDELAEDSGLLGSITHLLKNDPKLQQLWLAGNRDALLEYSTPIFEKLRKDSRITHFYYIDVNQTCFLRVHNPPRYGDHIDRFTLNAAGRNQKPSWGIELGVYGTFTLRSVHPWFVNGKLVGYIELGEEIEHITLRLKEILDVDLVFLIDKKLLTRENWEQGQKMMGRFANWELLPNSVVIDSSITDIPPEFAKFIGLAHTQHTDRIISAKIDGSSYRAGFVELSDVTGNSVGDILVIKNVSGELASLKALFAVVATLCFLVAVTLVSFFYIHITAIEKRLLDAHASLVTEIEKRKVVEAELQRHRDDLEETIKNRTAELEETNKHLQEEITERKKAEQSLQKSEERFKQVAECANEWIWEVNAEGLYTYSSPIVENLLGYKPEEIVGKKYFYDFFASDVKESLKKSTLDAFGRKESFVCFVNHVIHKNGTTVILETTGTPVLDKKGNLSGYRGADRDISERQEAQRRQAQLLEQLEKANKNLQEEVAQRAKAEKALEKLNADLEATVAQLIRSNRQLRDFAHLASHDLKTPLRGIGTLAQWLLTDYYDKFDENGRKQVNLLVKRAEMMDKIINAMLEYSTIIRNKSYDRKVNLNTLVKDAIVQIQPPQNIKVTINGNLPFLICEEKHVHQVFYNLIDNAVRFMDKPDGRITIDCAEDQNQRFWEFSISDNGPGIDPKHHDRIFQIFQTLADTDEAKGTGAGLTIVKKIVELYDGKVWLESAPGRGSTFFFTWPVSSSAVPRKIPQPAVS